MKWRVVKARVSGPHSLYLWMHCKAAQAGRKLTTASSESSPTTARSTASWSKSESRRGRVSAMVTSPFVAWETSASAARTTLVCSRPGARVARGRAG